MEPRCPYFGSCGGCMTQHLPYELQLKNKKENVSRLLGLPPEEIAVVTDDEFGYRNRMDFVFSEKGLGLREREKWWSITDVQRCEISNARINSLLEELRREFAAADYFDVKRKTGTFRYAVIRATRLCSSITFILNSDSLRLFEAKDKINDYSQKSSADNILIGMVPSSTDTSTTSDFYVVKGEEYLRERILDREFTFHSQAFFQNNTAMAEKMVSHVKNLLNAKKGSLLDNYGGVGLFGISCAEGFNEVTIIESDKGSIESADKNIGNNNLKNVKAIVLDAININRLDLKKPLHVVNDPPRSGMHQKALERLIALEPETLIYISCNPQQFAKELPRFQKHGYILKSATIFDLFPQTNHIELVTELVRAPR